MSSRDPWGAMSQTFARTPSPLGNADAYWPSPPAAPPFVPPSPFFEAPSSPPPPLIRNEEPSFGADLESNEEETPVWREFLGALQNTAAVNDEAVLNGCVRAATKLRAHKSPSAVDPSQRGYTAIRPKKKCSPCCVRTAWCGTASSR